MPRTHSKHSGHLDVALKYLPFLRNLTRRIARRVPAHVDFDDMLSVGTLGLFDSLRKYDPTRSERFESYAEFRIKGAILDELRAIDPLTREQRAQVSRLREARHRLSTTLGREPDDEELAAELACSLAQLDKIRCNDGAGHAVSLEALAYAGDAEGEGPGADEDNDEVLSAPAERSADRKAQLQRAMARLSPRLRLLLRLYYFEDYSLKEIGRVMGVTESRVCQLHKQALGEIREHMLSADAAADEARGEAPADDKGG